MLPYNLLVRLALLLPLTLAGAQAARAEIGSYLVFEYGSARVIAAHRPTAPWYPASLTKLMTAYVTFDAVRSGALKMTSPVTISPQAKLQPPSRMGFAIGTVITVETALRIILTKSANDVSLALAEAVGGTQAGFIDRMNEAARELGMVQTNYDNPHGLPNRAQVTSARDTALLMMALADDFPEYAAFFSMGGVTLGGRRYRNHNKMIERFAGADGMKTGFICSSGFNLAASATRDGRRIGVVALGGLTSRERDERTAELLAKGFEALAETRSVRLDGFGDVNDRLTLMAGVPFSGPMPAVRELIVPGEARATDLRSVVCGAARPLTRYSDGTVARAADVEAQAAEVARWNRLRRERAVLRREIMRAPRPQTALATEAGEQGSGDDAIALSDMAPQDWQPSAGPAANPLAGTPLRRPLAALAPSRPLTYLGARRAKAPVALRIGGADASRPDALSGSVVGGGPAPRPASKPLAARLEGADAVEQDAVLRHAAEVRADSGSD